MLSPFRTIDVEVDGLGTVTVPFTVELLHRVEDTLLKANTRVWFVLKRSEKSIVEAFEEFCRPYLPEDFPFDQADPTFCALFFSKVRDALKTSIEDCMTFMSSTQEPEEPTEERTAEEEESTQPQASS